MNKKKEQHLKNKNSKTPRETHNLTVKVLNSWLDKSKGLIGMEDICPIYFETRLGIHTFGMTKPIDVFILNKENEVIKIGRNIKPGRIFIWNPKYYKVLETAVNFINIKKLDKIIF